MEYNLNDDALTYQKGLQAYQSGLIQKSNLQNEYNAKAKQKDDEVNEPLQFITEAAMGKPIKAIFSKAKEAGVKWVKGKIRSKLGELGDRVRSQLPEGTSLEDVIKGDKPLLPENTPQAVRDGVNKLRQALGKRPIQPRNPEEPARDVPDSTNISEPAQESADSSAPEYSDFPADSPVRNQPRINVRNNKIKGRNERSKRKFREKI